MKRKIFLIFIILVVLIGLGFAYISIFYIPSKAKRVLTKFLEEKFGPNVEIGALTYIPLTTLIINDTTIYRDGEGEDALFKLDRARFNFSLFSFLTKKELISKLDLTNLSTRGIKLNGSLRSALAPDSNSPTKFKGILKLVDFSLDTPFIPHDIERFNGTIDLGPGAISLRDTYFYFNGSDYQLEGNLDILNENPRATFLLNNGIVASEGSFILKNDYIQIEKLNAKLADSTLNLIGDISNLRDPLLNIYGDSKLNIADLGLFYSKKKENSKLAGTVDAAIFLKGKIRDLRAAEFGFKAKSDNVSVHGFALKNFDIDIRMKDGLIATPKLLAKFYEGFLTGSVTADISDKSTPYAVELFIQNADLANWAKETKFGKKVTGILSSRFLVKGFGADPASLSGKGWLAITDGYLWEMPILGEVANVLAISGLKSVVFKEAAGNFFIGKRKVNISDLTFYSDDVDLSINGFVDFDTNLDLLITTDIKQDVMEGSSEGTDIANILIQQAGQILGRVKVTGTLGDPQYTLKPRNVSKPVEKFLNKGLGSILKDILE